uniref:Uncharacterized protein n=1 Tax=Panagrolaimus sp. ES5 TaxID=591445 RepID=A0AC34FPF1_9BILA
MINSTIDTSKNTSDEPMDTSKNDAPKFNDKTSTLNTAAPKDTSKSTDAQLEVNGQTPTKDATASMATLKNDAPTTTSMNSGDASEVNNGTSPIVTAASKDTSTKTVNTAISGGGGTLKKSTPKLTVENDSDDDCMIIDEVNPTKTTKPTPFHPNRKRGTLKEEKATPPAKKMNTSDEAKRAQLTVPDMLKDLFTS